MRAMSFVLNTLVIVVLSVPLTILLGPRVRSWRHRLDGPDGFDCGWRVVHGHVPGLASRWRQGQAHVQDGRLVWRRLPWWWPQARAAALVRPAAPRGARRSMPTREQARQALQVAERKDLELYLFLRLEATTGLRPGEVCALWWQDIDLDAGELLLGHNVVHAKGLPDGYIRKRTKTRHGDDRPIAVDGRTVALLAEHRARCEARAGEWGGKLTADGYVFSADEAGRRPLRVDTVTRRFGELAEDSGTATPSMGSGTSWPPSLARWPRRRQSVSGWVTAALR
jgi:integrase